MDFYSIGLTVITSGVLGIFSVAWGTYNKFVTMLARIEFIIERLEKSDAEKKEIFQRLNEIDKKIATLEAKEVKK